MELGENIKDNNNTNLSNVIVELRRSIPITNEHSYILNRTYWKFTLLFGQVDIKRITRI